MRKSVIIFAVALSGVAGAQSLDEQFRALPNEARRHTGPLFWLHGDANETPERLNAMLERVAESGQGTFTAESRPHKDWLGEGWYRDLAVCLDAAKRLNLTMWIFDEDWWPSQTIAGRLPEAYAAKKLGASAAQASAEKPYAANPAKDVPHFIALVAGQLDAEGAVAAKTLVDLTALARQGPVNWTPPADGKTWQVMAFSWSHAPRLKQGSRYALDGMSKDCVDWYIKTVYAPHHERFGADFGKTIKGYFYDEPETPGDWGSALDEVFRARGVDWKPCYVAWKFKLAGEDQAAAFYQYAEARAEAWGRTLYGGLSAWCNAHNVASMGHFMEHGMLYIHPDFCAGDMMRLQKYSDMGAIDLVCDQMYPGTRPHDVYQTPKLGSSISHVYGKKDDLAMCEIFGGYSQAVTYPEMKWLCDQHQLRGINFLIPHSFNPKAPLDKDYPPYFYNGGYEPRYPLFRVWADYASRLTLFLTGGRHVCPVALLFSGNAKQVGEYTTPEDLTSALQDALYDCDWLPFERFEDDATAIQGNALHLHGERYRAVVVPPTDGITVQTLAKVKAFYDKGGVVIGYGRLPSKSLTLGTPSAQVLALRDAIWGQGAAEGLKACASNAAGGRAYLLSGKPSAQEVAAALKDAGVPPLVEVLKGETQGWLHALRRVDREGRDVLFIANQLTGGGVKDFALFVPGVKGQPVVYDALRNIVASVPWEQGADGVRFPLSLAENESALIRFDGSTAKLPPRVAHQAKATASFAVAEDTSAAPAVFPESPENGIRSPCVGAAFQGVVDIPEAVLKSGRQLFIVCQFAEEIPEGATVHKQKKGRTVAKGEPNAPEEAAVIRVNGQYAGGFINKPHRTDITPFLKPGRNTIRIEPFAVKSVKVETY